MYGKYMLFYESPNNCGYYAHTQTVCTRSLLGDGGGPGSEARRVRPGLLCFSPFFRIHPCIILNAEQKLGRPGNEAMFNLYHGVWVDERCWSKCTTVMYVVINFKN